MAVGSTDLAPAPAVTAGMLLDLEPSLAAALAQHRLGFAWTGDVNQASHLHRRAAFAWLRGEVAREARTYAAALGCDLPRLQFHFQASWAVLSQGDERVSSHSHPQATLSAVYYVQIPPGPGGTLVFENVGVPNSLGPEFGEPGTPLTRAANPLNLREACYRPQEGRLILFPARQSHAVRPHGADALRISITFDILLSSFGDQRPDARDLF